MQCAYHVHPMHHTQRIQRMKKVGTCSNTSPSLAKSTSGE
jgi:hypothetical protein